MSYLIAVQSECKISDKLFWGILPCTANGTELLELETHHMATLVFKCPVLTCRQHHDLCVTAKQCQNTVRSSCLQLSFAVMFLFKFGTYIMLLLQLLKYYLKKIIRGYGELFFTLHFIYSLEIKTWYTH